MEQNKLMVATEEEGGQAEGTVVSNTGMCTATGDRWSLWGDHRVRYKMPITMSYP